MPRSPVPLLIGISARIYHPSSPVADIGGIFTKTLHYLEQSVAHWVLSGNALPVMIPPVESEGLIQRSEMRLTDYAASLDGLVLQGGADIAPESYGEQPLNPQWAGDRIRDRYETELFRAFVGAGKPVIGICRGCQLINVAFGGSLYQDIPTQRPAASVHLDPKLYADRFHPVHLVPGSKLAGLFPDAQEPMINSIHHQAVKSVGHDLSVEARAIPDGIVEAIRWRGPSYVFGMQWHPEFMAAGHSHERQLDGRPILREFLDEAAARRSR